MPLIAVIRVVNRVPAAPAPNTLIGSPTVNFAASAAALAPVIVRVLLAAVVVPEAVAARTVMTLEPEVRVNLVLTVYTTALFR